ncbi:MULTISPECIES: prolyl oligopeptidase family serine peptidase [Streptococcus]|uniref:prolyl oligopeptidase family serine peptidase n=1 Tax=Streptococcus TaxID=1301 RepID=UPI001EF94250|nr:MULTISPECIES: prolyl oligopeptidase family serine peptidase [Streptococcus]MCO8176239.1 prolyl oligopeptidase family serine peptidase [Streptococcus suis]
MKIHKTMATCLSGLCLFVAGCSDGGVSSSSEPTIESVSIQVEGYEFGPAVSQVLVKLDKAVKEVGTESLKVTTASVDRDIKSVYLADEKGNEVSSGESQYVGIDLGITYNFEKPESNALPFTFSFETFQNNWSETYPVTIEGLEVTNGAGTVVLEKEGDFINQRFSKDTERFAIREEFSGNYLNEITGKEEEVTLHYTAYQPDSLVGKSKNPLIIWLHGQGEGGTDTDITLLGNEVVALAREEIQNYFTSGEQTGAYVLAVQTPTYWMDEGDGTNGQGAGVSRYTEALMDAIKAYVATNEDIDMNRIYLAGCSNGGYMTLNLALHNPDYFAALVPQAAAYSYYDYEKNSDGTYKMVESAESLTGFAPVRKDTVWFNQEKLETIKHLPMWFIHSADDTIVKPENYALPVYKALLDSGADNKWFSYFETVEGADLPGTSYLGHWSWIYFFNNQVEGIQDISAIKGVQDLSGFIPNNAAKGGASEASYNGKTYKNLFEWLNDQHK